ncbi:tRNA (uracil) methyltransferase [Aspergillus melleus]|uniref:tRNA (uracil) methyltransferase n=1 Tax=Aspergillus melleus TaxID=138277 RepID=UPI001E8E59F6|nr:tRNA(Ser) Um(44) 2'-O-methyltransferase [Aspergillus melleus]KAH8431575.1 tRNA(Ser) Um(44) 2'-O-methyltransferase [Aspergillus melleus]
MPGRSKNLRNTSLLSGSPLSQTLIPSDILSSPDQEWVTSRDLAEPCLPYIPEIMEDVTVFLLGNININSSHLFRADILYDSLGLLKTPWQKERVHAMGQDGAGGDDVANSGASVSEDAEAETEAAETVEPIPAQDVPGFELTRTVVRRFIPRNPNLDRELEQTCHFYDRFKGSEKDGDLSTPASRDVLVVYTPHATSKEDTPYYHPQIRALALLYQFEYNSPDAASAEAGSEDERSPGSGTLSLHFLPFADEEISNRLERTLNALINTQIRLARGTRLANEAGKAPGKGSNRGGGEGRGGGDKPNKDNIIPQHLVQNTYTRLKFKYGPDLCRDWVESTEPSKHVFEDLSITAFLIELWRSMYGVCPADERTGQAPLEQGDDAQPEDKDQDSQISDFPGFVDVACGNGVLVYVLLMEGYKGWGFDARRRKTWSIFPADVQDRLKEEIYIPKPFHDALAPADSSSLDQVPSNFDFDLGVKSHTGTFPPNTFIISNHADELTLWTPLMGALSSLESPLPFLAIPCCSHALSGLKYRYPPPKPQTREDDDDTRQETTATPNKDISSQDPTADDANTDSHGSLHALRQAKLASQPGNTGFYKSTYGSLTAKTMSVAQEIGYGVESTLLRIPSTRNMGVIGGREVVMREWREKKRKMGRVVQTQTITHLQAQEPMSSGPEEPNPEEATDRVMDVVHRECARDGGIASAAQIWVDRARGIHKGPGRGNLNHHCGTGGH